MYEICTLCPDYADPSTEVGPVVAADQFWNEVSYVGVDRLQGSPQ